MACWVMRSQSSSQSWCLVIPLMEWKESSLRAEARCSAASCQRWEFNEVLNVGWVKHEIPMVDVDSSLNGYSKASGKVDVDRPDEEVLGDGKGRIEGG
ncbi:hypothetical protein AAC387_Pa12g1144 [Persea americana]